jgi:hypothetical protein
MLGGESKEPSLFIHPRCVHLIDSFQNCQRASRFGEWLDYPKEGQHPYEDMIDALCGGIRDAYPERRKTAFKPYRRVPITRLI